MSKLIGLAISALAPASEDFRFAAAVASFGMVLRDSEYKGTSTLDGAFKLAEASVGTDELGYRKEFVELVKEAGQIKQ